jgi:hypothetical protein
MKSGPSGPETSLAANISHQLKVILANTVKEYPLPPRCQPEADGKGIKMRVNITPGLTAYSSSGILRVVFQAGIQP